MSQALTAEKTTEPKPALDRHDIRLRDIVTSDDPRCPDDMDGCLVVSYSAVHIPNSTYGESREVSTRLPRECLVAFDDGTVDVDELSSDMKAWIQAASARYSNEIDFEGTDTWETDS